MKAMVFAAGIGSRLKALTADTPKCLVRLADGSTMLDKVIERLKGAGVDEVIINLYHFGEKIEQHVKENASYGIRIEFSKEESLLGTGGGLKKAATFFDSNSFFVHNSDVYSDLNLADLYNRHSELDACATLAIMHRPTNRPLLFSKGYALAGWVVDHEHRELVPDVLPEYRVGFSGIQVVSPKIFQYLEKFEGSFSTISAFMAAAQNGENIAGFDMTSHAWLDMGTPEKLEELNKLLGAA